MKTCRARAKSLIAPALQVHVLIIDELRVCMTALASLLVSPCNGHKSGYDSFVAAFHDSEAEAVVLISRLLEIPPEGQKDLEHLDVEVIDGILYRMVAMASISSERQGNETGGKPT